ncbi:39S ribosomal protein L13, mitochondrial [Agrilus planipennis]|uniref:39S ribosomal protein L13, mitochondrial n=1 Tax=Agrilus planipennis TaxID=224129 RepID=A0A1W4WU47_AGRPL|nr:39S ribosomal protein L13, mitochondrial [Agrilus planipennis]XP_018324023.1 39S ribosomal protein L13, mitochondrial [Agrilus planipennis]XP_018324024.1 39S ribosomal protein L13, mitochondrial [Agrilus planipennis]
MSALKRVQQWATFARIWHIYDATWQNPFESAALLKKYLMGLHKPIYHPLADCGDHVVVINCSEIALPGDEWKKRVYFHHTGYPGGASWTLAWELHKKNPTLILKKAIYHNMRGNLQRRYTMERLHLFPNESVPDEVMKNISNQIRQIRPVPKRLDHYTEDEVKEFPKLIDYPKDYIIR